MFDSLIIGAGTALVIGGFYFLFQKPSKKIHLYIQNVVLVILALILLFAFGFVLTDISESPILILPIFIVVVPAEVFIGWKLYKNYNLFKNNDFEE